MEILLSFHNSIRENYIQTTIICLSLAYFLTLVSVLLLFSCDNENCNKFHIDSGFSTSIHDKTSFRTLLVISVVTTMPMLCNSLLDIPILVSSYKTNEAISYRMLLTGAIIIPNLIRIYTLYYDDLVIRAVTDILFYCQSTIIIIVLQLPMYFSTKQIEDPEYRELKNKLANLFIYFPVTLVISRIIFVLKILYFHENFAFATFTTVAFLCNDSISYVCIVSVLFDNIKRKYFSSTTSNLDADVRLSDTCHCLALVMYHALITLHSPVYYVYVQIATILVLSTIPLQCYVLRAEIKEEKLNSKLNMLRYVSHEMRTPLSIAILGSKVAIDSLDRLPAKLLQQPTLTSTVTVSDNSLKVEAEDLKMSNLHLCLKRVLVHCNLAVSTLDDVLTFDKLDEKKLVLEKELVDNPCALVQDVINEFSDLASESQLTVFLQCIPEYHSNWLEGSQLTLDKSKIAQVLKNLISNAVKFSSVKGQVIVILDKEGVKPDSGSGSSFIRISVMDTGRGISPDQLKVLLVQYAIFDSEAVQRGGRASGLGLWLSKSIVEMHGGSLSAHSQGLGHGSIFVVELPVESLSLSLSLSEDTGVCPDNSQSSGVSRVAQTGVTRMSGGSQTYSHLADADDEEKAIEMTPTSLSADTYSPIHASLVDGYQRLSLTERHTETAAVTVAVSNSFICRKLRSLYELLLSKHESINPLLQSRIFLSVCVAYYCVVCVELSAVKIFLDLPHTNPVDPSLIERYPLPSWYASAVLLLIPMIINYGVDMFRSSTTLKSSRKESFYRFILIVGLLVPSSLSLLMWTWSGADLKRFVVYVQVQLAVITAVLVSFSLLSLTFHCEVSSADSEYLRLKKRLGRYMPVVFIILVASKTLFIVYSFSNIEIINTVSDVMSFGAFTVAQYMLGAVVVYHIRHGNIAKFESHNQLNDFLYASTLLAYLSFRFAMYCLHDNFEAFVYGPAYITVGTLILLSVIPSRSHICYIRSVESKLEIRVNVINYLSQEMKKPIADAIASATTAFEEIQAIANNASRMSSDSDRDDIIANLGEVLRDVLESCKVSEMTLEDLYVLDQLEDQKLVIEVESVNPWTLVHSVASPFIVVARSLGIRFSITSSYGSEWPEQLCLTCDKFKISQVVRNLISNALKFTPANGEVSIMLEYLVINEDTSLYRVTVTDSGAGISAENQKKMFGQYVQFNAAALQKGKGSGLGLWISKQIVNLHQGEISVRSAGEGCGSTFTLTLPSHVIVDSRSLPVDMTIINIRSGQVSRRSSLISTVKTAAPPLALSSSASTAPITNPSAANTNDDEDEDAVSQITDYVSHPSNESPTSLVASPSPRLHQIQRATMSSGPAVAMNHTLLHSVLIVDDSAPTRRMVARRLTPLLFAITEAKDGLECLELCVRSTTYDVILIDDAMPNLTGPEAIASLRAQGYSGLIVGVTGSADSFTMTKFKSSGADEVLTKPLDADKFLYIFTQYKNKSSVTSTLE